MAIGPDHFVLPLDVERSSWRIGTGSGLQPGAAGRRAARAAGERGRCQTFKVKPLSVAVRTRALACTECLVAECDVPAGSQAGAESAWTLRPLARPNPSLGKVGGEPPVALECCALRADPLALGLPPKAA